MKQSTEFPGWNDEDASDEFEDADSFGTNTPKRSSIRRKQRFREKELAPEENSRSRRKHNRQSIRTDNKFWED
jgi:hypothetical protein